MPTLAGRRGGVASSSANRRQRAAMPTHDCGGCHDLNRLPPVRPDAQEHHPEQSVNRTKARALRSGPTQHGELMPERQNLAASSNRERIVSRSGRHRVDPSRVS
jgi:hypothetical protein